MKEVELSESQIVNEQTQLFTIHDAGPEITARENHNSINYNAVSEFCYIWGES